VVAVLVVTTPEGPSAGSPEGTKAANATSVPVQTGYAGNESFCAAGGQPFRGTIDYRVSSDRATIHVDVRRLPKNALVGIEWSNNTVRGYLVGTVRTDGRGDSIARSAKLFRAGETRGYRVVLTWPDDNHALGNLWPCGPPPIRPPAIAVGPTVSVFPNEGLADGSTVTVTVRGFGVGEKVFLSECDNAQDANDLGCAPQLAAQPFIVTGNDRSATGPFVVSERAASGPSPPASGIFCAEFCVLVATQGDGFAWAVAPLAFGSSVFIGPANEGSTAATNVTPAPGPSAPCTSSQLSVTDSGGGAALGHVNQILLFTNTSSTSCTLTGYPGVAGLDAGGTQRMQARRTVGGYMGGLSPGATTLPLISIAPDRSASAVVEGTDDPLGAQPCPYYPFLLVTPPNLTKQVRVQVYGLGTRPPGLPGCTAIDVHPVVAGTTGSPAQ
jgi:hypothetical protein